MRSILSRLLPVVALAVAACAPTTSTPAQVDRPAMAQMEPRAERSSSERLVCGAGDSVAACLSSFAASRQEPAPAPATAIAAPAQPQVGAQGQAPTSDWRTDAYELEPANEAALATIRSFNGEGAADGDTPPSDDTQGAEPAVVDPIAGADVALPQQDTALFTVDLQAPERKAEGQCTTNMQHIALRFPEINEPTLIGFRRDILSEDVCEIIANAARQGLSVEDLENVMVDGLAAVRAHLVEARTAYDAYIDQASSLTVDQGRLALDRCTQYGADCLLDAVLGPATINAVATAWTLISLEEQLRQVRTYTD